MKILFVTSEFGSNGGGLSLSSERVFNYLSERYSVQIVNPKNPQVLVADGGYNQELASAIRHENDLKMVINIKIRKFTMLSHLEEVLTVIMPLFCLKE